ncbi:MAG TPA: hypothetical protein VLK53_10650 [Gaiellaceae bacterium]|nr:hypothetical protein [Gaiellaceae bacterium]
MLPSFRSSATLAPLAAVALLLAGCGGSASVEPSAKAVSAAPACPSDWRPGWQGLANQIHTPVYCPSWMPSPLDARIGGTYANGRFVSPDRSYLVSFVSVEHDLGGVSGEVHVNFRAYPGKTAIPTCEDTITENGATRRTKIPCFDDRRWTRRFGPTRVTAYTANQGVDQWHVLYAWRRAGTLYTLSEHVTPPNTYGQVVSNLNRMMRGLVLVRPAG